MSLTAVRIATFNINNVNRRLPNLLRWLETSSPDVVCLQELKCAQAKRALDLSKDYRETAGPAPDLPDLLGFLVA
jgi:exonuclease III